MPGTRLETAIGPVDVEIVDGRRAVIRARNFSVDGIDYASLELFAALRDDQRWYRTNANLRRADPNRARWGVFVSPGSRQDDLERKRVCEPLIEALQAWSLGGGMLRRQFEAHDTRRRALEERRSTLRSQLLAVEQDLAREQAACTELESELQAMGNDGTQALAELVGFESPAR